MKGISKLQKEIKHTPIVCLSNNPCPDVELWVKREELNHDIVQGNKWHKLKYNLVAYYNGDYKCIVSFGGAFSNHIYALAGACFILNIPCTIFMRGHILDDKNPTVAQLLEWGTEIRLMDFESYRKKNDSLFIESIESTYKKAYIIPEGGSNQLGYQGVIDFGLSLIRELKFIPDYVCIAAGTGATAAGIAKVFEKFPTEVLIFSSLKSMNFEEVLKKEYNVLGNKWKVISDYNFGGYAKVNLDLINFINSFYVENGIILDPIYTGKMFFGIYQMLSIKYFKPESRICIIHSGGLQGISGYNYLKGNKYGLLPH